MQPFNSQKEKRKQSSAVTQPTRLFLWIKEKKKGHNAIQLAI